MPYTLKVTVDPAEQVVLKKSGYSLCVSQKVNDKYGVANRTNKWLSKNTIKFDEKFQVFGYSVFHSDQGLSLQATTNIVGIEPGQTSVLTPEGLMQAATGVVDKRNPLMIENRFASLHFGAKSLVQGTYIPMYASEALSIIGTVRIQPERKLMVWFDIGKESGQVFAGASTQAIEVDFSEEDAIGVAYVPSKSEPGTGIWVKGDGDGIELPLETYDPQKNHFTIDPKVIPNPEEQRFLESLANTQNTDAVD